MNEHDPKPSGTALPDEEEVVRRLLQKAGPRPPIPPEDLDAISAAARSAWRERLQRVPPLAAPPRRRPLRTFALPLAAALAVALGLAWWWALQWMPVPPAVAWVEEVTGPVQLETEAGGPRTIAEGDQIPPGSVLHSGNGGARRGRVSLRLRHGATVRIDVATRLRLASATAVELERGALYVDTGTGPQSPPSRRAIEVRTPVGTVRDVGTQFAVRIPDSEPGALLIRVRDGAVLTQHRGRRHLTVAGQELLLHGDGKIERRDVAAYGPHWDWILETAAGFDIEGRSLREFLAWVSRETGWRIDFTDPALADSAAEIVLHGSIGELRPDQAWSAVLAGAGLEGELRDGTLMVRRR